MLKIRILMVGLLLFNLVSCATATRGTTQEWTIETTPNKAYAITSNGFVCAATPCTFAMPRRSNFSVDITLDGYKPFIGQVVGRNSGGLGVDDVVKSGGLVGVSVDATTGALLDLSPNPMKVILVPANSSENSRLAE